MSARTEELRARVVAHLVEERGEDGATLADVSRALAVDPPTLLPHLRAMVEAGQVERRVPPGTRRPRYVARPFVSVSWSSPERGIFLKWSVAGPVSWRFPLLTRVRDEAARGVLLRFLRSADERGLLAPTWTRARLPTSPSPFAPVGLAVVVYGSHARGDAGPRSDVDVLLVGTMNAAHERRWRALAAEANLWASPKVDLNVVATREFASLPLSLFRNVVNDGVTVFTTDEEKGFVEALRRGGAAPG